jgi:hypothetical protein
VSNITEVVEAVAQRLSIFEGRYTDHYPRWTLRDYNQVSILVSEVSTSVETIRKLQAQVKELETGVPSMARLAELETRSVMYDQMKAVLASTQARVAELEPDAKLGRMVREMPVYSLLCHESHWLGEWHAVWPGDNLHYNKQYGPTPEAALEMARREEP